MEVTIGKEVYRTSKLDAFKQLHIARKIGPALFAMMSERLKAKSAIDESVVKAKVEAKVGDGAAAKTQTGIPAAAEDAMFKMFKVVSEALASMSEEDSNFIVYTCLAVCEKKQPGGWQKVVASVLTTGNTPRLMFEDMTLKDILKLTVTVIQENLGDFFADPLAAML